MRLNTIPLIYYHAKQNNRDEEWKQWIKMNRDILLWQQGALFCKKSERSALDQKMYHKRTFDEKLTTAIKKKKKPPDIENRAFPALQKHFLLNFHVILAQILCQEGKFYPSCHWFYIELTCATLIVWNSPFAIPFD